MGRNGGVVRWRVHQVVKPEHVGLCAIRRLDDKLVRAWRKSERAEEQSVDSEEPGFDDWLCICATKGSVDSIGRCGHAIHVDRTLRAIHVDTSPYIM